MRKIGFIALTVLVASLGCSKKNLEYGLNIKDTIRINAATEPPTMDWTKMHDTASHMISINLMEGLTGIDYAKPDLPVAPALATEWKSSKDARVWTFTLRRGVKWSDGVELTPQHVLDGFERLLNAKTASTYSYLLFPIKNAEAYYKGKVKDFSQVGAHINDKGQIVVELEKPMSYFPYIVGHQATFPVRKDIIQKYGDDKWADAGKIVTLGPYTLKIWDHDKNMVLERFDGYYGEKAKTKNILVYMINDYSTALNLYQAGRIDYQEQVSMNDVPALKNVPGFRPKSTLGIYYYGFNVSKPPFDNVKVRQAFAYAIDRKQITTLLAGQLVPLSSFVPPGMMGYEKDIGLNLDVKKANQLLDEAGYKDRSKLPRVTIGFNTEETHQRIAENVQAQLKKNLGVQVELANEEWKVYLNHLITDAPSIFRLGWIADYPDPDTFLSIMLSYSENNHSKWKNKAYDDLIAQGATELNKERRLAIYRKAQKLLIEQEVPVFPIYVVAYNSLISPRLKDFPFNPLERIELKGTSIP